MASTHFMARLPQNDKFPLLREAYCVVSFEIQKRYLHPVLFPEMFSGSFKFVLLADGLVPLIFHIHLQVLVRILDCRQ